MHMQVEYNLKKKKREQMLGKTKDGNNPELLGVQKSYLCSVRGEPSGEIEME